MDDVELEPVDHQPQFVDAPATFDERFNAAPATLDQRYPGPQGIPVLPGTKVWNPGGPEHVISKAGQTVQPVDIAGDINRTRQQAVQLGGELTGVNDAARVMSGETPWTEAAAALIPMAIGGPEAKAVEELAPAARRVMTQVPDIRGMHVNDAIATAKGEPHLIPKYDENGNQVGFIGGPPSIQNYEQLQAFRAKLDQRIAANPQGGTWYDRYRNAVREVTGNNPIDNDWMTKQHAQWSAGVSPEGETQFTLKENNASLAGMPVKSARPAQHEAHLEAIAQQDPNQYQLGMKTGQYAKHNNPDQPGPPGATGVNDFRYQEEFGYPKVTGGGLSSDTIHKFMDYETALAVDRANQANLGGRSNWTGEQTQASPWVTQKAEALMQQRGIPWEEAYTEANKQIGDFFDKHTAFATHEAQPGPNTGHLPGSVASGNDERAAFAADPRSTWADPTTGRDAIYGDLRIPGTGVAMRVRPSTEMQGAFFNERNPGWTARPLVAFDSGKVKTVPQADQSILNAGEATRSYIDAQDAGAWHKPWLGGQQGQSQSLFIPREGKLTPEQIGGLTQAGEAHGLPNVVDTGRGVTMTDFMNGPQRDVGKSLKGGLSDAIEQQLGPSDIQRTKVDSGYIEQKFGGGAATRQLLDHITKTPELKAAFNNNSQIPQMALNRLERDNDWAAKWGAPREDIQNARRIIGQGPGWIDRLDSALKSGAVLPATAVAVMGSAAAYGTKLRRQ